MDEKTYIRSQRNTSYDLKITKEEMQEEEKSGRMGAMNIIEREERKYEEET